MRGDLDCRIQRGCGKTDGVRPAAYRFAARRGGTATDSIVLQTGRSEANSQFLPAPHDHGVCGQARHTCGSP